MIEAKDLKPYIAYMTIHTSYRAFVRFVMKDEKSVIIEAWFPRQKKWTKIEVPFNYQLRALEPLEQEQYDKLKMDKKTRRWNEKIGQVTGLSMTAAFNRRFMEFEGMPDMKERVVEMIKEDFPDIDIKQRYREFRQNYERGLLPDQKRLRIKKRGPKK